MESLILKEILSHPTMKIIEVLDENAQHAVIAILGEVTIEKKQNFVLKLKKKAFVWTELVIEIPKLKEISNLNQYFKNDIYSKHTAENCQFQNSIDIELIYPATEEIIAKNREPAFEIISETREMYLEHTLPFINGIDPKHIQWIHNILYNNAEEPKYKNDLFMILKNYTTASNKDMLDCIGIPFKSKNEETIKSLRDLNSTHLPLLEAFYSEGKKNLAEIFNVKSNEIRAFIHYPPTFYYFHVHYLHISIENFTACVNRGIDLREIIENIKLKEDYYQHVTIDHTVKIGTKLHTSLTKQS